MKGPSPLRGGHFAGPFPLFSQEGGNNFFPSCLLPMEVTLLSSGNSESYTILMSIQGKRANWQEQINSLDNGGGN